MLITGDGFVKLTDFGIARDAAEHTITGARVIPGPPAYLAPEIANGAPAGPASDAWSLGGTLYACVEGRPPFDKGTPIDTVASVVNDPVPPHPHAAALGPAISGLLVKSPSLRMTITQALTRLRGVADDPSGTRTAPPPARPTDHRAATPPGPATEPIPPPHHLTPDQNRVNPGPRGGGRPTATRAAPSHRQPTTEHIAGHPPSNASRNRKRPDHGPPGSHTGALSEAADQTGGWIAEPLSGWCRHGDATAGTGPGVAPLRLLRCTSGSSRAV